MKVIYGTHRIVFIVGNLVFKIPRVEFFESLRWLKWIMKDCFREITEEEKYDDKLEKIILVRLRRIDLIKLDIHCLTQCFFDGFFENFREVKVWCKTKHTILAKLYLPLIVVNVYKREEGIGVFVSKSDEIYCRAFEIGDDEFFRVFQVCAHTFDDPQNFSYDGEKVKILDYGEHGFEQLISKYGD